MTWDVVARKEFRDAVRSRWLWALTVVFVLFTAGAALLFALVSGGGGQQAQGLTSLGLLGFLLSPAGLLVPIIGLVVSYKAVAGERDSGSLKLLLGLPHSRLDVLLGKVVGRGAVVGVAVVTGFVLTAVVVLATFAAFSPGKYLAFVLLTLLLGAVYIAIGVGLSAAVSTASRALAAAVGFFVVIEMLWGSVVLVLYYLSVTLGGGSFSLQQWVLNRPDWAAFLASIPPSSAFSSAASTLLPRTARAGARVQAGGGAQVPGAGPQPFYLADWFGLVILVAWGVGMFALGYRRFEAADL